MKTKQKTGLVAEPHTDGGSKQQQAISRHGSKSTILQSAMFRINANTTLERESLADECEMMRCEVTDQPACVTGLLALEKRMRLMDGELSVDEQRRVKMDIA
ncbi:hypothetical protein BLNAU_9557 [Blattamonas nauphoetae]|uniref:Uncharacterized protein n=1 Tax=Blattamonas nauphoetae TaxID=2049346 RepID=A0ABQ9XVK9_9EUKA|nr:hypothetical protein BLNAU_9557 [Blattamonas nauphoetae]